MTKVTFQDAIDYAIAQAIQAGSVVRSAVASESIHDADAVDVILTVSYLDNRKEQIATCDENWTVWFEPLIGSLYGEY
jgi:hypothetical protein